MCKDTGDWQTQKLRVPGALLAALLASIHPTHRFSTCYWGHRKPNGSGANTEEKKRKEEKKRPGGRKKKPGRRKTKNPWLRTALKDLVLSSVFTPL